MGRPDSEALDYEAIKVKPETTLQTHLADWIIEKTGVDEGMSAPALKAFREGVRLATVLRMAHQASPENQERQIASASSRLTEIEERRAATLARREARAAERAAEAADKPAPKKRGRPKKVVAEEPAAEPVKKSRGRPKKAAAVEEPEPVVEKTTPKRRTRAAAAKPALTVVKNEAPTETAKTPRRRAVAKPAVKAAAAVKAEEPKPTVVRRRRAVAAAPDAAPVNAAGVRTRPKPRTAPSTQEAPF